MRKTVLALLLGGLAAVVTACSSSSAPASTSSASSSDSSMSSSMSSMSSMSSSMPTTSGTATVQGGKLTIDTTDKLRFMPSTIMAKVGTVRITLTNSGSYPHNLSVPSLKTTSKTVTGDPGNTSTTFTLKFTKPGRYPFVCTYHAGQGMTGTFVVS